MEPLRFKTKISKTGVVKIPDLPDLSNKEVEIIIISEGKSETDTITAYEFIDKWAGIIVKDNNDDKLNYLRNKYK